MSQKSSEPTITQSLMTQTILLQSKAESSDEDLASLFKAVHALKGHISGLISVSAGENQSTRHRGFTHGIVLHFTDEAHLRTATQQEIYTHMLGKVQQLSEAVVILELPETFTFSVPLPESAAPAKATRRPSARQLRATERTLPSPFQRASGQHVNVPELLSRHPITSVDPRLQNLIIEQLGVEEHQVVPDASLVEDLNADSLDLVEYFMGVELLFQITISDEDVQQLMTVGEMQAYLLARGVL